MGQTFNNPSLSPHALKYLEKIAWGLGGKGVKAGSSHASGSQGAWGAGKEAPGCLSPKSISMLLILSPQVTDPRMKRLTLGE